MFFLSFLRPIRTALTSNTSGYGSISGSVTPIPLKSPAVSRAIAASHRRALSVRSKASIDGKRKR